jgi:amino acid transporter
VITEDVAPRVGGTFLFQLLNATLLIANMGSAVAAQFSASRLMYSMGRDKSLPPRIFGAIDARRHVPLNNVLIVGFIALMGAFLLTYEQGAELLNFGAFIAFIGVNMAALVHYKFRSKEKGHISFPYTGVGSSSMRLHLDAPEPQCSDSGRPLDRSRAGRCVVYEE